LEKMERNKNIINALNKFIIINRLVQLSHKL